MPDGEKEYRTFVGSMLSIATFTTILIYGMVKISKLATYEDYKILTREEEGYFAETEFFDFSDGFVVAAGIFDATSSNRSRNTTDTIPPEIGAFGFYIKRFGQAGGLYWEPVETRWCTSEDFNLDPDEENPDSRFFKTKNTAGDVRDFGHMLQCPVNPADMAIFGNYESGQATNL